jgi:spermidine synthase
VISYQLSVISCQFTDHRSPATDHRSPITDHRSPATDHRSPVTDHRSPATDHRSPITDHRSPITLSLLTALAACAALVIFFFAMQPREGDRPVIHRERGFFGTVKVLEAKARSATGEGVIHEFVHGNTVHGIQALIPGKERMPTTYFTPRSGGYAVVGHPKYARGEPMRVNILGLGVGVMLCYARTNDYYRCYEISPEALRIAEDPTLFTFVKDCPARLDLVREDARKGLEKELASGAEKYDVIQIDAFTGDNLPYHLSTMEAFELYFKMLKPGGVLAVNISNWHLSLETFVKAVGRSFDCPVLGLSTENDFAQLGFAAKFAFFCYTPDKLAAPPKGVAQLDLRRLPDIPMPTDEKGSFNNAIRWR